MVAGEAADADRPPQRQQSSDRGAKRSKPQEEEPAAEVPAVKRPAAQPPTPTTLASTDRERQLEAQLLALQDRLNSEADGHSRADKRLRDECAQAVQKAVADKEEAVRTAREEADKAHKAILDNVARQHKESAESTLATTQEEVQKTQRVM